MYRRPKFLEVLDEIRAEMSREVDYDVDLFAEMVRRGGDRKSAEKPAEQGSVAVRALVIDEIAETRNYPTKIKK